MYSAAQEQFGNNPFAQLLTGNGKNNKSSFLFSIIAVVLFFLVENTTASRTETNDPLPNPWAPRGTGAASTTAAANRQQPSTGASNNQQQQSSSQQPAASAIPSGAPGSSPGLISPMMQNYMSQLVQNPRLLESVLNAPYMQPLMDSLAANPEISRQMIANNPMFADNPQLREQMINALPAMMEQMRNPEVQSLMQNREALEAITQIQEGLKCLKYIDLISYFIYRSSTFTYRCTESFSSVNFHRKKNLFKNNKFFYLFSGGLPAGLRFGPTGLTPPTATAGTGPTLTPGTGTSGAPSASDPSNYAGVFAQMLDMMSNQNIVCFLRLHFIIYLSKQVFFSLHFDRTLHQHNVMLYN